MRAVQARGAANRSLPPPPISTLASFVYPFVGVNTAVSSASVSVATRLAYDLHVSDTYVRYLISCFGQRPKTRVPGPFGAKNMYIRKPSQKRTLRVLILIRSALYLFSLYLFLAE